MPPKQQDDQKTPLARDVLHSVLAELDKLEMEQIEAVLRAAAAFHGFKVGESDCDDC